MFAAGSRAFASTSVPLSLTWTSPDDVTVRVSPALRVAPPFVSVLDPDNWKCSANTGRQARIHSNAAPAPNAIRRVPSVDFIALILERNWDHKTKRPPVFNKDRLAHSCRLRLLFRVGITVRTDKQYDGCPNPSIHFSRFGNGHKVHL